MVVQAKVAEEHGTREDQGCWVSLVLTLDIKTNVTATGLKDGDISSHVASRNDSGATDQSSSNVGQDTTIQVGHDHDVKLLRSRDSLHRGVVDNHIVGFQSWVVLGNLLESAAEETIRKLHDVGLVDTGNLLAVVGKSKAERKLGNALGFGASDNLERFDDSIDGLVLEARVFTLGVLTDDAEVNIVVAGLITGNVLNQDNGSIDVELLSKCDVERLVAGSFNWGVKNSL